MTRADPAGVFGFSKSQGISRPGPAILPSIDPSALRFWRPAATPAPSASPKGHHTYQRLSSNRTHPAQARGSGAQPSHTAGNKRRRSLVFTHANETTSASPQGIADHI